MNYKRLIKIGFIYILWFGINVVLGVLLGYNLYVSFVIIFNFLDVDVIEGIYIKFGGGVILIYVYYFCYVLEVVVVCNLDLYMW